MTIIEAIHKIDELKPNAYAQNDKVAWLSTIDGTIKRNIIDKHWGSHLVKFDGYDENTSLETELLAYPPYDELYIQWLESKIDYYNGEYVKYNNAATAFSDTYTAFENDYNRTHKPHGRRFLYY